MKLIQIQYFLTIEAHKSITKAAEQLFVSQPAVTKQMNLLEEELGVRLMKRTHSGVELTEAGEEFAKDMKKVMSDFDRAVAKAVNAGSKDSEELRIGCFDGAVTDDFLPKLYAGLKASTPQLHIKLMRQSIKENRKALDADDIDVLIEPRLPYTPAEYNESEYGLMILAKREGALIFSKNSPLARKIKLVPADFEKEVYYTIEGEEMLLEGGLKTLHRFGIRDPKVEAVENFATMMSNIELGLGYATLARTAADASPQLKALPLPEESGMQVIAVWKKKNRLVTRHVFFS